MADADEAMPSLPSYLARIRGAILGSNSLVLRPGKVTLVMGNPSADLDSFVSAVVLSYFYNRRPSGQTTYVPILNLPTVRASELWRLRPEFAVALGLALGRDLRAGDEGGAPARVPELEQLVTIADVKADETSPLHRLFTASAPTGAIASHLQSEKQSVILVDHNAPSIPGLDDEAVKAKFRVEGCVDHHVDEAYVSSDAEPRIVMTGIGSCTSLVVKHLREEGLWPTTATVASSENGSKNESGRDAATEAASDGLVEISKLALAPILIDTSNLRATGDKCSDTDREAVSFLEGIVRRNTDEHVGVQADKPPPADGIGTAWDRDAYHRAISTAKANSLSLLTTQETFDRDYKAWNEAISSSSTMPNGRVNIGISSLVKPLSWLVRHAGGVEKFVDEIVTFATDEGRDLSVFAMLTRAVDGKEVVVVALREDVRDVVVRFQHESADLRLTQWCDDVELLEAFQRVFAGSRIWWMGDTSKSRKQVAPLLREVVRSL